MAFSWPVGRLSCTAKGAARGFLLECPQFVVAATMYPLHRQRAKIAAFLSQQIVIFTPQSFHPRTFCPRLANSWDRQRWRFKRRFLELIYFITPYPPPIAFPFACAE